MGNAPTKKGDPENGIINFAGASVVILMQAKNLHVLFSFPVVKAFLSEAKEQFNLKWEHPSQVRIFSCSLVNYRVVSSFGFI